MPATTRFPCAQRYIHRNHHPKLLNRTTVSKHRSARAPRIDARVVGLASQQIRTLHIPSRPRRSGRWRRGNGKGPLKYIGGHSATRHQRPRDRLGRRTHPESDFTAGRCPRCYPNCLVGRPPNAIPPHLELQTHCQPAHARANPNLLFAAPS